MSSGQRIKFFGTTFEVQTGFGSPKTITAITAADPPVVSITSHGYTLGDVVKLNDIEGMVQVDGGVYPVDNPATSTFELPVDGSGFDAFVLASPNLADATEVTFSSFCELTGVNKQGAAPNEQEVTTICSTAKEFETGLSDSGSLQLDYNFYPNGTVQTAMREAEGGDQIAFRITFPGTGGIVILVGTVQQSSFTGSVGDPVWKGSSTVKLSGDTFVLEAS